FARAGQVLGDNRFTASARAAADFIKDNLYDKNSGILLRRYRDGGAAIDGYVDDYAFLIHGLLDLYETTFDVETLTWAVALQQMQNKLFWDDTNGGYFNTSGTDDSVLLRMKDDYDGAEPSPNSVAAMNLIRLAQMTASADFASLAEKHMTAFRERLQQVPHAMPRLMMALECLLTKPKQIVIAGDPKSADTQAMVRAIHQHFVPNKILLLCDGETGQATLAAYSDFLGRVTRLDGRATAYVCENFVCQLPTTDPEKLLSLMGVSD
ncbi:MAG: thioredoxin domain-containing protein, partial [Verrucomicrobia bacterium]|nr:thioredoxin domain-containing protein [Verrucomicrobiota bacterium]